MVQAVSRGLSDAIEDPDEAYEISKDYVEGLDLADEEVQKAILTTSIGLWRADRLGYAQPQAWRNTQDVLLEMGLLDEPQALDQAFTNEFIP
jgi:NitT/TauT family transport system substrate-binding protein